MEDLNAYIESGVLELYVLGQLQPEEMLAVEAMAAKHSQVKEEIAAIELALEQYALDNGIEPSQVFDAVGLEEQANNVQATPKIVQLQPAATNKTLRMALVACVALLVVSLAALYTVYTRLGNARAQLVELSAEKQLYTKNVNLFEQQNKELQLLAAMPDHPEWTKVRLKGVGKSPDANLMVYWNKQDHRVMVNNNNKLLPGHDTAHQYQLWAIVANKPVDLGVFDAVTDSSRLILEMKAVKDAQAFAVTIEKLGGSPAPDMNNMVVMGGL